MLGPRVLLFFGEDERLLGELLRPLKLTLAHEHLADDELSTVDEPWVAVGTHQLETPLGGVARRPVVAAEERTPGERLERKSFLHGLAELAPDRDRLLE